MNAVLKHGDYQGSVSWEDGVLIIRILHIDDSVTDEVEVASEVSQRFADLVDDYIETCAAVGKEPCRPFKGSFNVRITPELHRNAVMAATKAGISLNALVEASLVEHLDRRASISEVISIVEQKYLIYASGPALPHHSSYGFAGKADVMTLLSTLAPEILANRH